LVDGVSPGTDFFIFNNKTSAVGSTVNLGSFAIGTELIFRLHVNNTGFDYFTGASRRNPDGNIHARVQSADLPSPEFTANETLVSFEDLFNGPFNFNDLGFSFTNTTNVTPPPPTTPAPIPSSIALVLLGLAEIRFVARRH